MYVLVLLPMCRVKVLIQIHLLSLALIESDIFTSQKQFHGRLNRMLRSKATRKRIQKMMGDTKKFAAQEHELEDDKTQFKKMVLNVQKVVDCVVASSISVISSIFHVLFSLDAPQMMALCLCIALLTNILMAYRLSSISGQLDKIGSPSSDPRSSSAPWYAQPSSPASSYRERDNDYKKHGVYQLEQSIDTIHRAMFQLQNEVRDQTDRLHRLGRL
ncbi:hypothetical protein BDB00DRAFT_822313 [Zychaea mexicana]|uniref:uncharacterized protein n=1 Tax=Zychaea mexicana TaxID=64656 RepID=UPI0022FEA629|nr:uncharacterized protein BDB00DRAFT_822313 [Zychaea mexicana]KAI9493530.1 hypothetical protein BDB00DRAFT_822313 [Zychaea mexicana]